MREDKRSAKNAQEENVAAVEKKVGYSPRHIPIRRAGSKGDRNFGKSPVQNFGWSRGFKRQMRDGGKLNH